MNFKPIIIVAGEPNSIFFEIFFKSLKKQKFKSPLILIASHKLLLLQMKKLKYKKNINLLDKKNIKIKSLSKISINLINVNYDPKLAFEKISSKSNNYIKNCFSVANKLLNTGISSKLINGPISKKCFLHKNYPGMTEYIAEKNNVKKKAMLIYNKSLSVCPLTTHVPLKNVSKKINKKNILEKVILINSFYKTYRKFKPKIAILGLNPHCESTNKFNEDEKL